MMHFSAEHFVFFTRIICFGTRLFKVWVGISLIGLGMEIGDCDIR